MIATEYDKLTADELADTLCSLQIATLQAAAHLNYLCHDPDEATRHIRLAFDTPPTVLRRRYDAARAKLEANGELSISEAAAWVACGHTTVQVVAAALERKQLGAGLN